MSNPPSHFQPTWCHGMLAAVLATAGFLLPQEAPLDYMALNQPSAGQLKLEITCAADVRGETQIYLNTGRGFNEFEKIRLPISPGGTAYTYTFPLPDAPLLGLRLDPFIDGPGEFILTGLRIIDRSGQEVQRFTREDCPPTNQIVAVVPMGGGWKLITARAGDPYSVLRLPRPVVPAGMNSRNLRRCLLSCGYLALMIWILLLAVYFALRFCWDARSALRAAVFLAFIAGLFSLTANRGLIKNSVSSARYRQPPYHLLAK